MLTPAIYEFRNYTLRPGQRDVLIDLFEREFIESQEVLGARVVATFRDLDDPDRFVWIRAFDTMQSRAAALDGFYTGPIWQRHRAAANATIIDSDNVLQLRPVSGSALREGRAPIGARNLSNAMFVAVTYFMRPDAEADFAAEFARQQLAAPPLATFATEHAPNSYPRLPVREGESVFVTLTRYEAPAPVAARLDDNLARLLIAPPEIVRLQPTARSALR